MTLIPRAKFESRYKLADFVMDAASPPTSNISPPAVGEKQETTQRAKDFVDDHFQDQIREEVNRRFAEAAQRGLAKGTAQGRDIYVEQIATLIKELDAQGQHLTGQLTNTVTEAIRVAFGLLDPVDAPRAAIEQVLSRQGYRQNVSVMICPADVADLEAYGRGKADATGAVGWRVMADPDLLPGEVIVESILGRVHVGLAAQANHAVEMVSGVLE
ncbi:MAG: Nodulation protein NolV [Hyphomicrobiales bacterium]|nr:Nodulation protein NolV [Hyphomicrobiales bacterium]